MKSSKLIIKIISWIVDSNNNYGLIGDLEEIYNIRKKESSKIFAEFWLIKQVFLIQKSFFTNLIYWGGAMFKNYFKVTFRNLIKQKVNSIINITGLSIGITFSVLILLFVQNEFSFDKFNKNAESIFRINKIKELPGRPILNDPNTPMPLKEQIDIDFPEIVNSTRINSSSADVEIKENIFTENVMMVDREFFSMFSFPVLLGNPESLLPSKNSVVISSIIAEKYFGSNNPINKILKMSFGDEQYEFIVSAVIDNRKNESSYELNLVVETDWFRKVLDDDWVWTFSASIPETFVQLPNAESSNDFESRFQSLAPHFGLDNQNGKITLVLQNLLDIHHDISKDVANAKTSDPFYAYMMLGLGILILFVACINFMTLNIGKAPSRAKEVGVRKVLGAFRKQISLQYLSEAILTSTIASIIGLLLAWLLLPEFNSLSGKELAITFDPIFITGLFAVNLIVGILAGSYPAFVLSGFTPSKVLKGKIRLNGKNLFSRILVVFQFSLSIILIISTLLFKDQLNFINNKDLGFDKESIIEVSLGGQTSSDEANKIADLFQNEIGKNNRVINSTRVFNNFGVNWSKITARKDANTTNSFYVNLVDSNFLDVMNIKLSGGRNFSSQFSTDYSEALIVNKAFVKHFEWDNPFDKQIPGKFENQHRIVGVVEDFNYHTLHSKIQPMVICQSFKPFNGNISLTSENWPPLPNYVYIKVSQGSVKPIIDFIKTKWSEVSQNKPFEYKFLDVTIEEQYKEEEKMNSIINYSSAMAILIATLGLFGLATLAAESKIKEIGIRKVLGSSIRSIILIVSKDLLKLVLISNLIAWPIAYYLFKKWLENFAYQTNVEYLYFLFASILVLAIAAFTIGYHAVKAAKSNPINALKYE